MQGLGYTASVVHRPRWAYTGGPRALPCARLPRGFPEAPRSFLKLPRSSQRLSKGFAEASQKLLEACKRLPRDFPGASRCFPEAPRSFRGLRHTASVVHRPRWAYTGGRRASPRARLPRGSQSVGFRAHGLGGPPASVVHRPRWACAGGPSASSRARGLGGHWLRTAVHILQ